mmetsp:Transcript_130013/g.324019  ORF Transcript_130013/g.324019 Transcript_130013/m.324019 type:complete len:274 (-) Transcript_130013:2259-3080(-)
MGSPTPLQILLHHLGFRLAAEMLHKRERPQKGCQDLLRKLQDKFLATLLRARLRASQISEPMRKVERDVTWICLAGSDNGLKLSEQGTWRRLRLHEPAHVVLHVALGELYTVLLFLRQAGVGGQRIWDVLQDVAKSNIVISDHLARLVSAELLLPGCHCRHQLIDLHDVMNGREHEHRQSPFLIVCHHTLSLIYQHARSHHNLFEQLPIGLLQERASPCPLRATPPWAATSCRQRLPIIIDPEAEGLGAIAIETHQPIHREEGPDRSLVLIIG